MLGHFHEIVGESPGRLDTRILAPADLKNLFWFPSYGHLNMPDGSKSHFPCTGPALKLKILRTNCPFECGGGSKSYLDNAQMNVDFDSVGLPYNSTALEWNKSGKAGFSINIQVLTTVCTSGSF